MGSTDGNRPPTTMLPLTSLYRLRVLYVAAVSAPIVLGAVVAWHRVRIFDVGLFVLCLVAAIMLQAGTTMTNDAFDLRYHEEEAPALLPLQVLQGGLAFFVVGGMVGMYIALLTGPAVIVLGGVGVVSALAYSVPPVRLAGTGVGELLAGFNLSAVTALGSYYVQTGHLSAEVVVAALPCALLLAGVLAVNGFRPSRLVEHRPLWQRLGPEGAFAVCGTATGLAFGVLSWALVRHVLPTTALLAWGALPPALAALWTARRGHFHRATRYGTYTYLAMMSLLVLAYLLEPRA
ncbi:MAG: prenyltransferase [Ardenticatenia bacterium]|nr:prenyltransferase [Ardenticatenia bacterium]